jgi:diacylglycerol kinase (ATP)
MARALRANGISFDHVLTEKPGDATVVTRRLLLDGATTVVAVGGDGTASEVANGFFAVGPDSIAPVNPNARLGLIAAGTDSVVADTLGLRGNMAATVSALRPCSRTGRIDVGRVQFADVSGEVRRSIFIQYADIGVGSEAVQLLETRARILKRFGRLAYQVVAIWAVLTHRSIAVDYVVDDSPAISARINLIMVANGRRVGGGFQIAPDALLDDGHFDVVVSREVSRVEMLLRLFPALLRGDHVKHPAVSAYVARSLSVRPERAIPFEVDGNLLGTAREGTPVEIAISPGVLPVALPDIVPGRGPARLSRQ